MKLFLLLALNLVSLAGFPQDAAGWDESKLNTGNSVSYLDKLEKEVLLELNKARTNPEQYARLYIEPMLHYFDGNLDTHNKIVTNEGTAAVRDCIEQMKATRNMIMLDPDQDLSKAATRHTSMQSKTNETGHTSPNGETFEHRVKNIKFSSTAECISYGGNKARDIVVALLVDDGVSNRGHRKIILNPRYSFVGIAAGAHRSYRSMCTLDFGGGPFQK